MANNGNNEQRNAEMCYASVTALLNEAEQYLHMVLEMVSNLKEPPTLHLLNGTDNGGLIVVVSNPVQQVGNFEQCVAGNEATVNTIGGYQNEEQENSEGYFELPD